MAHPRWPIVEAGWLATLALTPVFLNPWPGQVLDPAKAALVRLLALFMLGGWLLSPCRGARGRPGFLRFLVLGWLTTYAVATGAAIAPAVSLLGGSERGQGLFTVAAYAVLLLLVGAGLTSRAQRERAVTVILITSVPVALYAIIQRLGLDPLTPPAPRPDSTLGGPIFLGAYLLMTAPLALARLLAAARQERRRTAAMVVHAAVFALQSAALLLALSRGPFLGFVAALLTLALLDVRMGGARRAAPWVAACVVAVLLTVGGASGFMRLVQPGGGTTRVRVLIWEATMRLAGPHEPLWSPLDGADSLNAIRPFVGYGPESLYAALGPFHPDELARLEVRKKPDRAHNDLLDALATTGALGLLAQLALVVGVLAVGLEQLGMIAPDNVPRLVAWCATGATSAAILAGGLLGVGWIAAAVGWGLIAGTLGFVVFKGQSPGADDIGLAALLAGVVGHVVETQVGIATTTSWVYFAFFAGVLAARADRNTPDEADRPALYGIITGLILSALAFQFLADGAWAPGTLMLLAGTVVGALLLTSTEEGSSPRQAAWFVVLALAVPVAFALPEERLVRRAAAGHPEACVYALLLFIAFVTMAVVLAAHALRGERMRSAVRPHFFPLAVSALVLLAALVEVGRLWGAVLGQAAIRSGYPIEQRILLLQRARRLQLLDPRADALLGAAYMSLADGGLPQHALARAEEALLSARRLNPMDADYTLDLARLHRAAARLLPAHAVERLGMAVAYYEAAARLDPAARHLHLERAAALADHARACARAGDFRTAADARQRATAARARARELQRISVYKEPIA